MLRELRLMPIKKWVAKMSHFVISERTRRGQKRNMATLLFSSHYSGDLVEGDIEIKKSQLLMSYPEAWKSLDPTT